MKDQNRNFPFNQNELDGLTEILRFEVLPDQWDNIKILLKDEWKEFSELVHEQLARQQSERSI